MERTLHSQLKHQYGPARGGQCEVMIAGFRIDAIEPDGTLVEVQTASLSPLRDKLARLLAAGHRFRVVKPIIASKRIVWRDRRDGPVRSSRLSPKRETPLDIFDDLVGVARLFRLPGLRLDILSLFVEEQRVKRVRWPGYSVLDRSIVEVRGIIEVRSAVQLWLLLPKSSSLPTHFTTNDLACCLDRPLWFAQRVAYCLHHAGVCPLVGKRSRFQVYDGSCCEVGIEPELQGAMALAV